METITRIRALRERVSAWRFINPPEAFVRGILVDRNGKRICNEMLYGAQLAERIMKQAGGKAWVIIDRALRDEGTSYHYAAAADYSDAAPELVALAGNALRTAGLRAIVGATWTTDAPFRETAEAIEAARAPQR